MTTPKTSGKSNFNTKGNVLLIGVSSIISKRLGQTNGYEGRNKIGSFRLFVYAKSTLG